MHAILRGSIFTAIAAAALLAATPGHALAALPATDNAGNAAYNDGWQNGDNGGSGWGGGWSFSAGTQFFLESSTVNGNGDTAPPAGDIDTAGRAWGIGTVSGNAFTAATREFSGTLAVGQGFAFYFDNGTGFAGPGGSAAVALRNSDAYVLWNFAARDDGTYAMSGPATGSPPLPAFTDEGLFLDFKLSSATTYSVAINVLGAAPVIYAGTLLTPTFGNQLIQRMTFTAFNTGNANAQKTFLNGIAVVPEPSQALFLVAGGLFLAAVWRRRSSARA